jgi:hypothetical protein
MRRPEYIEKILLSLGGRTTIRHKEICQLLLAVPYWRSTIGQIPDPLIKSQGKRGLEPNIDKKAQPFRSPLAVYFGNERCMFCSGSGTKPAQPVSALALQAAFADINIHKSMSVYYVRRLDVMTTSR